MTRFSIYLLTGGIGLGLAGLAYIFWPTATPDAVPSAVKKTAIEAALPELRTVMPTISNNFSTLLLAGTVQSYETAKIAARSEGIVSDVYAEIGDRVSVGQTLVTLLPHGVEGQASAEIAEARAMRDSAQANYDSAVRMAAATQNRSRAALDTTKLSQTATVSFMEKSVWTAQVALASARSALTRAQDTRSAKIAEATNAVNQAADQAVIASYSAYEMSAADLVSDRNASSQGVTTNQLPSSFGALDTNTRQVFIASFNAATNTKNQNTALDVVEQRAHAIALVTTMMQLLTDSEALLRKTISDTALSQTMIDDKLKDVHVAQKDILEARQMLTNEMNNQVVMQASEDADIARMENELNEKQAMLVESQSNLALTQQDRQKENEMAQKDLAETTTEKTADVAKMRVELAAAEATLIAKLTASGHAVITAAMTGTIAKRLVNVGDAVMANQSVFEIVAAETALAKKTKVAIQFGAPEELFSIIAAGDPVEIVIPGSSLVAQKATITSKAAQIDPASRTFTLLARLADDAILPPNSNVRVRVATEKNPAWTIPTRAVKRVDGMNHVWLMRDGQPTQAIVDVLAEDGEFADVKSVELTAATQIILDPPESFLVAHDEAGAGTISAPMAGHTH